MFFKIIFKKFFRTFELKKISTEVVRHHSSNNLYNTSIIERDFSNWDLQSGEGIF